MPTVADLGELSLVSQARAPSQEALRASHEKHMTWLEYIHPNRWKQGRTRHDPTDPAPS